VSKCTHILGSYFHYVLTFRCPAFLFDIKDFFFFNLELRNLTVASFFNALPVHSNGKWVTFWVGGYMLFVSFFFLRKVLGIARSMRYIDSFSISFLPEDGVSNELCRVAHTGQI